ncbi:MAG: chemoreceptor glutamine deamidase CheD [Gammaproteobacteria bacterium]|nr:chemoreceptor glutamine deamidase CheD [Gammaproteobacteria bacterium]
MKKTSVESVVDFPAVLPGFEHVNRYWDKTHNSHAAKILPGEYYVTLRDEVIVTVLGSCISACIRDSVFGVGGMNHFMLPTGEEGIGRSGWNRDVSDSTRYGNFAMEKLVNDIMKNGGRRNNLEVKIFGGGKVLAQMTGVGERNIHFVKEYIKTEGLRLVSEDVGDIYPRKVYYFPASGKVRLKKLRASHNNTIAAREKAYKEELVTEPISGDIELF